MTRIGKFLPPTSLVRVPKVHHYDVYNNFFIMEDCGTDVVTLREFLSSATVSSVALANSIGTAVGEFIALIHEWSRGNPDGILDTFDKSVHAKKLLADLAYDRVLSTLQRSDKDDLPFLSDFELDAADVGAISKLTDEYRSGLMSARVPGHDVVSLLKSPSSSLFSMLTSFFVSSSWETFGTKMSLSMLTSTRFACISWIGNLQGQDYPALKLAYSAPT